MSVHPLDHALVRTGVLRSDMTDVTLVTCKVRVNGGAATTYTNVTTPAITQDPDCAFIYQLDLPADTFADAADKHPEAAIG